MVKPLSLLVSPFHLVRVELLRKSEIGRSFLLPILKIYKLTNVSSLIGIRTFGIGPIMTMTPWLL